MNILAMDTSTSACSVALQVGGQCFDIHQVAPRKHSQLLLGFIDEVLNEAGVTLQQLDLIAVGQGPGSFMGVRLAVSVAKSLAFAANLPTLGFSTLQLLAQTAYREHGCRDVMAAWDARMAQMYVGHYQVDSNGVMQALIGDCLVSPQDWQQGATLAVGNAWLEYRSSFSKSLLEQLQRVEHALYPCARDALIIAKNQDPALWISAEALQPSYFRAAV